jgi:hypothetical protein
VGAINVGVVDNLIEESAAAVNSGDQNEIDWVNGVLSDMGIATRYTTADLTKYTDMNWLATDAYHDGIWAINFQTTPEYFFIKTGEIQSGEYAGMDHFLYENLAEFTWGVIDLYELGIEVENIGKISHVGELGDVPVPEPLTLLLLGLGLAGTAAVRRFKK